MKPPRSVAFDLFGEYLRYRGGGGEARLCDIVALLAPPFGVGASTARVVMLRLRKEAGSIHAPPVSMGER